ncbi:hypothetical protein E3J62_03210 [candidate division TA06 bacterium]|uniref:Dipeptidylpeptidase IV N-terminal domain-containing protein n=1 Tax=candidate division TA06 bacterium TaxID=2250710 RepID=A0A523UW34_UNCT6|nr:MAG: hypothetical protein E3J62_03210 [candidate division TA06 bacterium]
MSESCKSFAKSEGQASSLGFHSMRRTVIIRLVLDWLLLLSFLVCYCGCEKGGFHPGDHDWPWIFRDLGASFSPDGEWIAYAHRAVIEEGDTSGVHIMKIDGSNRDLVFAGLTYGVDWSPDSSKLVFEYGNEIWSLDLGTDSVAPISPQDGKEKHKPVWSAGGEKIAYTVAYGDDRGVWVMDSSGENAHLVVSYADVSDWFPSGSEIGFSAWVYDSSAADWVYGIWSADTAGSEIRLILLAKTINLLEDAIWLRVSPDGSKLAIHGQQEGRPPEVWVINADGSNPKQLTQDGGMDPAWSPTGQWIVYTDGRDGKLWLIRPDGTDQHPVDY